MTHTPRNGRVLSASLGTSIVVSPRSAAAGRRILHVLVAVLALAIVLVLATATPAAAQDVEVPEPVVPGVPTPGVGTEPTSPLDDDGAITIDIGGGEGGNSQSVILIVGLAVLSLAPSLILMLTSFTRIIIVFTLTRNALGLQTVPPNQVLVGLALFLSLFIMSPTLSEVNEMALQPYLDEEIGQAEALELAAAPMREFMLAHTGSSELEMLLDAADRERPESVDEVGLAVLIPAFLLSEIKTAFIIGFVIFIPFVVIDIVVAAVLMALGMMMLPPVFVSLPFKLLLFIMVGGWSLIVETLLTSFL
ncbi:MAG: flagellar type III secretion system pore protein FliP [Actinomycetota bacterium]